MVVGETHHFRKPPCSSSLGGGNSNIFGIFTQKIGEDEPNLTSIFFKWVETANSFRKKPRGTLGLEMFFFWSPDRPSVYPFTKKHVYHVLPPYLRRWGSLKERCTRSATVFTHCWTLGESLSSIEVRWGHKFLFPKKDGQEFQPMVEICTTTAQEQLSEIGAEQSRGVSLIIFCWELII